MSCSICMDDIKTEFKTTKCNHVFCNKCIMIWIMKNNNCPICRCRITDSDCKTELEENLDEDLSILINSNINNNNSIDDRINDLIDMIHYDSLPYFKWYSDGNQFYTFIQKKKKIKKMFIEVFKIDNINRYYLKIDILNFDLDILNKKVREQNKYLKKKIKFKTKTNNKINFIY